MTPGIRILMLLIAVPCWIGVGAAIAQLLARRREGAGIDPVLASAALALAAFGGLTTAIAAGPIGIPALGGTTAWVAWVVAAQRSGAFRIERRPAPDPSVEESPTGR